MAEEVAAAALLLERGADPAPHDALGLSALHWAARSGSAPMLDLLLRHHAEPKVSTATKKLRIVTGRQNDGQAPNQPQRRTRSPRYAYVARTGGYALARYGGTIVSREIGGRRETAP
jgi:hypothetical protein